MNFSDVSIPEVYNESQDFRFFIDWFSKSLTRLKYDGEHLIDLYDPVRCPANLLWLLGDTIGYKFDDRLPNAFNRLVMLYFMSMIYNRGSRTGMMLAAELNLAQFNIQAYGTENEELFDRLEDTSIPVNSAYVTSVTETGHIDIVYLATEKPTDACTEYVRPLGMYCFQNAGVFVNAKSKISVDARLTDENNMKLSVGPTKVGRYRRSDFTALQKMRDQSSMKLNYDDKRNPWFYRNVDHEVTPMQHDHPGYRTLAAFQLANNDHIVKATLKDPIFSLGYGPQDVDVVVPEASAPSEYADRIAYNLTYNKSADDSITRSNEVTVLDITRSDSTTTDPKPKISPIMATMGDAISMNSANTQYTKVTNSGTVPKDV